VQDLHIGCFGHYTIPACQVNPSSDHLFRGTPLPPGFLCNTPTVALWADPEGEGRLPNKELWGFFLMEGFPHRFGNQRDAGAGGLYSTETHKVRREDRTVTLRAEAKKEGE